MMVNFYQFRRLSYSATDFFSFFPALEPYLHFECCHFVFAPCAERNKLEYYAEYTKLSF